MNIKKIDKKGFGIYNIYARMCIAYKAIKVQKGKKEKEYIKA